MGQALALFPLAFLMIENVLATLDRNLEDGASDLGASDLQVLRTITLPLVAPGLLKAGLMVFALSMADFATPAVLGGGLAFLAQDALLLVIGAEYDLRMASVLCVFLMLPSLGAFVATTGGWRGGATSRSRAADRPPSPGGSCRPSTARPSPSPASPAWPSCSRWPSS